MKKLFLFVFLVLSLPAEAMEVSDKLLNFYLSIPNTATIENVKNDGNDKGRWALAAFALQNRERYFINAALVNDGGFEFPQEEVIRRLKAGTSKQIGTEPSFPDRTITYEGKKLHVVTYTVVAKGEPIVVTTALYLEGTKSWRKIISISVQSAGKLPLPEAELVKRLGSLSLQF